MKSSFSKQSVISHSLNIPSFINAWNQLHIHTVRVSGLPKKAFTTSFSCFILNKDAINFADQSGSSPQENQPTNDNI